MPVKSNGSKYLLYIGGGIAVSVAVSVFLFVQARATCPLPEAKRSLESKIELHYQVIKEDISEIKESIKLINSKIQ